MAGEVVAGGGVVVDAERLLVEVRYALRQLREWEDCDRAADALERAEELLRDAMGEARG